MSDNKTTTYSHVRAFLSSRQTTSSPAGGATSLLPNQGEEMYFSQSELGTYTVAQQRSANPIGSSVNSVPRPGTTDSPPSGRCVRGELG